MKSVTLTAKEFYDLPVKPEDAWLRDGRTVVSIDSNMDESQFFARVENGLYDDEITVTNMDILCDEIELEEILLDVKEG